MIKIYDDRYKEEVIDLILHVQNVEYDVGISAEEQPDILDIESNYLNDGGCFWVGLNDNGEVVGSIGLQKKTNEVAVLKKFWILRLKPLGHTVFIKRLDLSRLIKGICRFNMITLIEIHLFLNWIYLRKYIELTGAILV